MPLCLNQVGVVSITNLGISLWRYAGNQVLGWGNTEEPLATRSRLAIRHPKPPYLTAAEEGKVLHLNPPHEKRPRPLSLDFAHADKTQFGNLPPEEAFDRALMPYNRDLIEAYETGNLPRVVVIALNPDELTYWYAAEITALWERFIDHGALNANTTLEEIEKNFPLFAPACNGIVVEAFDAALRREIRNSAKLSGFLNALGCQRAESIENALLGTVFRFLPLQAGQRITDPSGELVYMPLKIGNLEVAGGTKATREEVAGLLNRNYTAYYHYFHPVTLEEGEMGPAPFHPYVSRLLIDRCAADYIKAMFTININALAIALSLREGNFVPVTMGDMARSPEYARQVREYAQALFNIAHRAGYMTADDLDFERELATMMAILEYNHKHKTSSLKTVEELMAAKRLSARLGPNEQWIFGPALAKALEYNLHHQIRLLSALQTRLQSTLEILAQAQNTAVASA